MVDGGVNFDNGTELDTDDAESPESCRNKTLFDFLEAKSERKSSDSATKIV